MPTGAEPMARWMDGYLVTLLGLIDAMHPKIIKELREELGEVLADIMRKSMITGEIPQDWRDANIVPIYKKGNRSEPGNYRPVSLTCIVCKVMERIIKNH